MSASGPPAAPGAVLIRSDDPELQLQGLRTALSLSMGDRPAGVFLTEAGLGVLAASPESEAGQNLIALTESGIAIVAERVDSAPAHGTGVSLLPRGRLLAALAAAEFQQTF